MEGINGMIGPSQRRRASALQDALERYERALEAGTDPITARAAIAAELGDDSRVFLLAAALPDVAAPMPEPAFAAAFAAKLRSAEYVEPEVATVLRPRFGARVAPLAIAACTILFAALLIPAFSALPGDNLYALKGASEDARVWFATGPDEAQVRVALANERFGEVEALLDRAQLSAMAPGLQAGGVLDEIDDPALGALIEETLAEASRQLEKAADILTTYPVASTELDDLVDSSRRGQELASLVADELPNASQPPVVRTVVKLAKVEAKAKAARMKAQDEEDKAKEPTPAPCDTPAPTPTPDPTPDPADEGQPSDGSEPELTPGVEETPEAGSAEEETEVGVEADPTATPDSTPCISPSPTPEPTDTVEPESTPEEASEPTPGSEGSEGVDADEDEHSSEMVGDDSSSEA
jgi:hypothetical protein